MNFKNLKAFKLILKWLPAIAVLIFLVLLFTKSKPQYTTFSNHNPLKVAEINGNLSLIKAAENNFNSKNYSEALKNLNSLSQIYLNNTQIKLYKGICYLETNAYFEANAIFTEIEKANTPISSTATWYKALNHLKQNQYFECKITLKTIPSHSLEYRKAQELIKQL